MTCEVPGNRQYSYDLPQGVGVCDNAQNHISILTTKLFRLSKISRYL